MCVHLLLRHPRLEPPNGHVQLHHNHDNDGLVISTLICRPLLSKQNLDLFVKSTFIQSLMIQPTWVNIHSENKYTNKVVHGKGWIIHDK